jgi:hypothetical protein
MSPGDDLSTSRLPGDGAAPTRPCPYCGALALRAVEETHGTGVLAETLSVCYACGQSITSPHWTAASTRRGLLLGLWTCGPVLLFAVAAWLLKPYLPLFPHRTPGAT